MGNGRWRIGVTWTGTVAAMCLLVASNGRWPLKASSRDDRTAPTLRQSSSDAGIGIVGVNGCSARACHGRLSPLTSGSVLQNEYTTWMQQDPHAHAYDVLLADRSRTIAKNLAGPRGLVIDAHEDARCLACHSIPARDYKPLKQTHFLRDGVSCEACHGAAEKWLVEHTRESWRTRTPQEKQSWGMKSTQDLPARAQLCTGCHVGAPAHDERNEPARDAFHDILAAGHPRLSFEFGNFLSRMPHHWIEADKAPDFELRVWLVGQIATVQAALELLATRAQAAHAGSAPWPEFAEYDCFACHHDLNEPSWRQRVGDSSRRPGALPWGTWTRPMIHVFSEQPGYRELRTKLDEIDERMTISPRGGMIPNSEEIASRARSAATTLDDMLRTVSATRFDAARTRKLAQLCISEGAKLAESNWDAAAQLYLALVAMNQVLKDDQIHTELNRILKRLDFPTGFESPRQFRSDDAHDRRFLESELRIIQRQIEQ